MARKRQQDLTSGEVRAATTLTPLASPVNIAAAGIGPTPVDKIAFDFRNLSRSLDSLSRRSRQRQDKKNKKSAEEGQALILKLQAEGIEDEEEINDRWRKLAEDNGLTEASTIFGQREISRGIGRQKGARLMGAYFAIVDAAKASPGSELDEAAMYQQAIEDSGVDIGAMDHYQMQGIGPAIEQGRAAGVITLAKEEKARETEFIWDAASARVAGTMASGDAMGNVTSESIQETMVGLMTSDGGGLFPKNVKRIGMNGLLNAIESHSDDHQRNTMLIRAMQGVDFNGTLMGEDTSVTGTTSDGLPGPTIAQQLSKMEYREANLADAKSLLYQREANSAMAQIMDAMPIINLSIMRAQEEGISPSERQELVEGVSAIAQGLADSGQYDGASKDVALDIQLFFQTELLKADSTRLTRAGQGEEAARQAAHKLSQDLMFRRAQNLLSENQFVAEVTANAVELGPYLVSTLQFNDVIGSVPPLHKNPNYTTDSNLISNTEVGVKLPRAAREEFEDAIRNNTMAASTAYRAQMVLQEGMGVQAADIAAQNFQKSEEWKVFITTSRDLQAAAMSTVRERAALMEEADLYQNTDYYNQILSNKDKNSEQEVAAAFQGLAKAARASDPTGWSSYHGVARQVAALNGATGDLFSSARDEGDIFNAVTLEQQRAVEEFRGDVQSRYTTLQRGNSTKPESQLRIDSLDWALQRAEKRAPEETVRAQKTIAEGGLVLHTALEAALAESVEIGDYVSQNLLANDRSLKNFFGKVQSNSENAVTWETIAGFGDDFEDDARLYYSRPPGENTISRAGDLDLLQRRTTDIINKLVVDRDDAGKITDEAQKSLYQIIQVTPGMLSILDMADTESINFRTESGEGMILRARIELRSNKSQLKVIQKRVDDTSFFNPLFGVHLNTRNKLARKVRDGEREIQHRTSLDEDVGAEVNFTFDLRKLVIDGNINPYRTPWKNSFSELQLVEIEHPKEFAHWLRVMGITDRDLFMSEQRKAYR